MAALSDTALYYIGGVLKHARAINAFTNATTNSYKRLVKGFEAPTLLAYSARNRSAAVRSVPFIANPKGRRVEVRFPDSCGNPYFAFIAMLMAGLDGIQNQIHPGDRGGQGSLRSSAGRGKRDPHGVLLVRAGDRRAGSRSRLPEGWRMSSATT